MHSCLPENTALLIKDSAGEIKRVTLDYFDAMLNDEPDCPALGNVKVLGREGWVELSRECITIRDSVALRQLAAQGSRP